MNSSYVLFSSYVLAVRNVQIFYHLNRVPVLAAGERRNFHLLEIYLVMNGAEAARTKTRKNRKRQISRKETRCFDEIEIEIKLICTFWPKIIKKL